MAKVICPEPGSQVTIGSTTVPEGWRTTNKAAGHLEAEQLTEAEAVLTEITEQIAVGQEFGVLAPTGLATAPVAVPAPAAPTQTPWTDAEAKEWTTDGSLPTDSPLLDVIVGSDFARSLERLCRQQHEAISCFLAYAKAKGWTNEDYGVRMAEQSDAAYAAFAKEMKK